MNRTPLEKTFDLPAISDLEEEQSLSYDDLMAESRVAIAEMTNADKIDLALTSVTGLYEHDGEMEDISKKAIKTYEDLVSLGMASSEIAAGKIFENASKFLQIAMDSRNAKVERKLKTVDLMLKKQKLEQDAKRLFSKEEDEPETNNGHMFDRNDLIRMMRDASSTDATKEP